MSESARRRIADSFAVQAGAVAAAQAAVAVANQLVAAHDQAIAAWLEDQGVDPKAVRTNVDLKTGIVTTSPKEET